MTVLIVVLAVFATVLVLAYLVDRRARAEGHQLRASGSWRAVRETRRDVRAATMTRWLGRDLRWTSAQRRDIDARAQRRREEDG